MIYDVYIIKCLINDKVYIGRSQELDKRWRAHKNMLRGNKHNNISLQEDWNKYGEDNFIFKSIYKTESLEDSIKIEQNEIDCNLNKYNISDAKMGGDTFTNNPRKEEISKLKSIASSGKRNPMYGVPKTDYMIQKTKEANSKKISIEGVEYSSMTEASKALNIGITTISYRLKSKGFSDWNYL